MTTVFVVCVQGIKLMISNPLTKEQKPSCNKKQCALALPSKKYRLHFE